MASDLKRISVVVLCMFMSFAAWGASESCISSIERAPVHLKPLSRNNQLRTASEEVASDWRDNNISTGKSSLIAALLTDESSADNPKKLSEDLFHQNVMKNTNSAVPENTRITTSGGKLSNANLKKLVLLLAEGNALNTSNPENLEAFSVPLQELIPLLGDANKNIIYISTAKLNDPNDSKNKKQVTSAFILNTSTRKLLMFYIVEGTL